MILSIVSQILLRKRKDIRCAELSFTSFPQSNRCFRCKYLSNWDFFSCVCVWIWIISPNWTRYRIKQFFHQQKKAETLASTWERYWSRCEIPVRACNIHNVPIIVMKKWTTRATICGVSYMWYILSWSKQTGVDWFVVACCVYSSDTAPSDNFPTTKLRFLRSYPQNGCLYRQPKKSNYLCDGQTF